MPSGTGGVLATTQTELRRPGLVTITFDDGRDDVFDTYWPIMRDDFNMRGVVAPTINNLGTGDYLTLAELVEMYCNGWEVASHTIDHNDLKDISLSNQVLLEDEIWGSLNWFRTLSPYSLNPVTFVYPYGTCDHRVVNVVKKYYQMGLGTSYGESLTPSRQYAPSSMVFPTYYMPRMLAETSVLNDGSIQTVMDNTVSSGGWAIWYLHNFADLTEAEFRSFLTIIRNSGLPVVTAAEGLMLNGAWRGRSIDPIYHQILTDVSDSDTNSTIVSCVMLPKRSIIVRNTMDVQATIKVFGGIKQASASVLVYYDQLEGDIIMGAGDATPTVQLIDVSQKIDFLYIEMEQSGRTSGNVNAWVTLEP